LLQDLPGMRLQFRHPLQPLLGCQVGGEPLSITVTPLKLFGNVVHVSIAMYRRPA
jgi:hypothetical protein